MEIASLFIYPIKSCGGIEVNELHLLPYGPCYDRQFVIVDETGNFLTQRQLPKLCLVKTTICSTGLRVAIPGTADFVLPLEREGGEEREVKVWDDTCRGLDEGDAVAEALSSFLGMPCRLVRYLPRNPRLRLSSHLGTRISISFADAYPLLVISRASLDDLNRRLDAPLPMNRFRPNIVIGGARPYEEDEWREVKVDAIRLRGVNRCVRCATTLADQKSGTLSKEPLRTLETYRRTPEGVVFGRNFIHRNEGVIRKGDAVEVC